MTTIRQRIAARLDPEPANAIDALTIRSNELVVTGEELRTSLLNAQALADARKAELLADLDRANAETGMLRDSLATFWDMLQDNIVSVKSPQAVVAGLQEGGFDQALLDQMLDQLGWDRISTLSDGEDNGQQRTAAVAHAVRMFRYSPLAQWSIWLWTGWGLGDAISATLKNNEAQAVWDEFVAAERNEPVLSADVIHELSDWLLVKGNRYLALFTATTGENAGQTTIRVMDQDEIKPVGNPQVKLDTWFYKRTFTNGTALGEPAQTLYYPDHQSLVGKAGLLEKRWKLLIQSGKVPKTAKRADKAQRGTTVSILHIAHNRKDETSPWGWPITTASGAWVKGQKQYSEARLGVAMSIAQFVRRSKVKGGSRAVASVVGQIASTLSRNNYLDGNPPPTSGSWHAENEASTTKELPMRTGAGDAKDDNELFSWMALLGMGLFPTSAGLDTSRWATALEMDKAQSMIFERYKRFWASQFRKLVRVVLLLADKYNESFSFEGIDTLAEISTDTFSLSDYPDVSKAVADQVSKMLTPYAETGIIPEDTVRGILAWLWSLSADALVSGTGKELFTPEAFGVGQETDQPPDTSGNATDDDADDEEDDTEPGMESAFIGMLKVALENLEAGEITVDQFAEFMMAEIGEVYREQGETTNDQA